MFRTLLFSFVFLLNLSISKGQSNTLKGKLFFSHPYTHIFLYEIYGKDYTLVDTLNIIDNTFETDVSNLHIGYYYLTLSDTNSVALIINPTETEIYLQFFDPILSEGIQVIKSQENKALWEYKYFSKALQKMIDPIMLQGSKAYIDGDTNTLENLKTKLNQIEVMRQDEIKKFMQQYPETYFNEIAKFKYIRLQDNPLETRKHFFDSLDFSNPTLLYNPALAERIDVYIQQYTPKNLNGFKASVDTLLYYASTNQAVYDYVLSYLFEQFDEKGPPIVFQYLVEHYYSQEACSELKIQEEILIRAQSYLKLMAGNSIPNLNTYDINGNLVNINAEIALEELSLLFFWSSHCHHCHDAIPIIKTIREQYPKNKLKIIGISLDDNKAMWEKAIQEHQLNWVNCSDLKGWESNASTVFLIHKTPSFFVVNNKGIILSKPENISELQDYFKSRENKN